MRQILPKYKYGFCLFGLLTLAFLGMSAWTFYSSQQEARRFVKTMATVIEGDKTPDNNYLLKFTFKTTDGSLKQAEIHVPFYEWEEAVKNGSMEIEYNPDFPDDISRPRSPMLPLFCLLLSACCFISMQVYRRKLFRKSQYNQPELF